MSGRLLLWRKSLPFIFIWGMGILVYFKSLFFGLTYLDDNVIIINSYRLLNYPANFLDKLFRLSCLISDKGVYYRPLPDAFCAIDTVLGRGSYFVYHLTNLIIHLLAASFFYVFLMKLRINRHGALDAALIFTVHPALTQAVAWITGRIDSLLGMFVFLSAIFFINFSERKKFRDYFGCVFFFALALLTKETALVLPFLYFFLKPFSVKRIFLIYAGCCVVIGGWFILRRAALPGAAWMPVVVDLKGFFKNLPVLVQYSGKTVFPFNLSVSPLIQDTSFVWGGITIILMTVLLFVRGKTVRPWLILFGIAWFFLFLAPGLFISYPSNVSHFYEHRLYVPLAGVIIVFCEIARGLAGYDKYPLFKRSKLGFIFICFIVVLFSWVSFEHIGVFKDRMSFWQSAVKTSPHSPLAHRNLGAMYYLDGKLDRAEEESMEALRINPYEPMANNNLGLIFMKKGRMEEAEQLFLRELSFNPDYDNANFNLGLLYYRQGKIKRAMQLWEKTIEINPGYKDAYEAMNAAKGIGDAR